MSPKVQVGLPPMELSTRDGHRSASATVSSPCQSSSIALIDVVKDALIRHFGSLKAAGIELKYDLGQLSRDLQSGDFKFRRLEGHKDSDAIKRLITQGMLLTHGPDDPKTRRRRVIRDLRQRLDELDEIEDAVA